ncbi:MAG: hypothetical protein RLZZ156_224 [Deinococcota bacterium]|jgi:phosphatidylserine/phosphatidylglycerophosphate/cardiolipin synthase-like enzyme
MEFKNRKVVHENGNTYYLLTHEDLAVLEMQKIDLEQKIVELANICLDINANESRAIFLRPNDNENKEILNHLESFIINTQDEICIAVAYFTEPKLTNALAKRHQNGYQTRLILNTSDILRVDQVDSQQPIAPGNILRLLKLSNMPQNIWIRSLGCKNSKKYENMHHKFLVTRKQVYFGSLNWTQAAFTKNFEALCYSRNVTLVDDFRAAFENLWEEADEICIVNGNKISKLECSICGSTDGIDMNSAGFYCCDCGNNFTI